MDTCGKKLERYQNSDFLNTFPVGKSTECVEE